MKRLVCILLVLVVLTSMTSCVFVNKPQIGPLVELNSDIETEESVNELEEPSEKQDDVDDHQELIKNEVDFDPSTMLRISIPEIGLENVVVRALANGNIDGKSAQIYILGDDRYGGRSRVVADLYLVIKSDGVIFAKDIGKWENQPSHGEKLYLCDTDGDGDFEIIVQELIAISGGAGGYLSLIYDFNGEEIIEIFSSSEVGETGDLERFDTGFSLGVLEDKKIKIENSYTGYSEVFDFGHKSNDYFDHLYSAKDINSWDMLVDSFYEFVPEDYDNDGIFEIKCRQYTSLCGHTDFIGWAVSYLKYNNETKQFVVVKAYFEPETANDA